MRPFLPVTNPAWAGKARGSDLKSYVDFHGASESVL